MAHSPGVQCLHFGSCTKPGNSRSDPTVLQGLQVFQKSPGSFALHLTGLAQGCLESRSSYAPSHHFKGPKGWDAGWEKQTCCGFAWRLPTLATHACKLQQAACSADKTSEPEPGEGLNWELRELGPAGGSGCKALAGHFCVRCVNSEKLHH